MLDSSTFARMTDVSVVRADVEFSEVEEMASFAIEHGCIGAHAMPCYVRRLSDLLSDHHHILVGGVVGFPFGSSRTEVKVLETRLSVEDGAREIDVVQNVGFLRSGWDERVVEDIRAVVEAASPLPVKVILETAYLSRDEIVRSCVAAKRAGAAFVKTSTGHGPAGATPEHVALMRETVGDDLGVKAAGGMRDAASVMANYRAGATRFGVGLGFAREIIRELQGRAG